MAMENNNAAALRQWLRGCPDIAGSPGVFGADYLPGEPGGFALDNAPSPLRYRENILGGLELAPRQEQLFVLAARMDYGSEAAANLDNLAVFQRISAWITERSAARDLPAWEGGEVVAVAPSATAWPVAMSPGEARYQMQIRVVYRVE